MSRSDSARSDRALGWKARVKEQVKAFVPEGSKKRAVAVAGLRSYREGYEMLRRVRHAWQDAELRPVSYAKWHESHQATSSELIAQRSWATHNAHAEVQVILLPGASASHATRQSIREQSVQPVRVSACESAADIVRTIDESNADLFVFCSAGDMLAPNALYEVVTAFRRDPRLSLITWDDDVVEGKKHLAPRFKPSWSPEMLLGENYIGQSFAASARAIQRAGGYLSDGFSATTSSGQIWDLLLRINPETSRAHHIARVLTSLHNRSRCPSYEAVSIVRAHLSRLPEYADASAETSNLPIPRVRWSLATPPHVSIVIPTRHNRPMLSTCLASLAKTGYASFDVHIVDNGGYTPENEKWYEDNSHGLELKVTWWTEQPFNYSAVNNAGASATTGDVLVFLNDDTEILDEGWLTELVGWAQQPGVGTVGPRLIGPDGEIQHMGVWLGVGGFADHVFQGMQPGEDSIFGSTDSYRNTLAVTGACVAIRRDLYESIGGFDERFQLTGSDVALGLDCVMAGLRNVCTPHVTIRHLESATRGTAIPDNDFYTSYWKYNTWLFGGDPYYNHNLSLVSRTPRIRSPHEPGPRELLATPLHRDFKVFRQTSDAEESRMLAEMCNADRSIVAAVRDLHAQNNRYREVKTVNWFIPDIDSPFYGGINTAFRIADYLTRKHGVQHRMITLGQGTEFIRTALAAAFPRIADSPIIPITGDFPSLRDLPEADAAISTLWVTAYALAHAGNQHRKFYLVQDYEPMFYPAGTNYALTEETYRLGLYGICNTENLKDIYTKEYGGKATFFTPAVDPAIFHARDRHERDPDDPVTIFVYARPGHWRNCWELAAPALEKVKNTLGSRVRIVTAGAWATGGGAQNDIKPLGLMPYKKTGDQYRETDLGLALTVSKHPSYLPLELMSCGAPVVAFDNPWGHWILRDGENSLLCMRTIDDMADQLIRLASDDDLRHRLQKNALEDIAARHGDWDRALSNIYSYLCDPEKIGG